MFETDYYAWYPMLANELCLISCEHDKKKDRWSFVHATMRHFPAIYKDGKVTGITTFIV